MFRKIWGLFWHGFRVSDYGTKCNRCGGYEYSQAHPRGMMGRKIFRWYL